MFWHRKNNADWMILLQATEMIKNVFKMNISEGKRKLENFFDIRDYLERRQIMIHSCNFMIPAPLFYEVNDPLLQVCYKP